VHPWRIVGGWFETWQSRRNNRRALHLVALSIIIPTFNRLWSLPQAIESCRATRSPCEIIVVDDGSTDGTSAWLARQPDIIAITTENWGKDRAVNTGFARAQGQYVRFLDSDDWLEPGANDAQIAIAQQSGADVVLASYRTVVEPAGPPIETAALVPTDDFTAQQLGEGEGSHYSAFLFRRDFIRDIPHRPEFLAVDDRMFVLEVALGHPRLAWYDAVALVHRHHDRGRLQAPPVSGEAPIHRAELEIYRKILPQLEARGELTERRRRAAPNRLWPLAHRLARHDPEEAARLVDWIYELDPSFRIPDRGALPTLYRWLGFRAASRLLRLRRRLLAPLS
jgi:glycosyltransferase involved in cell wall biosynthesis